MSTLSVAVFVGSLRRDSINRKMALAAQSLAPGSMRLSLVDIGNLGFYNQDLEGTPPAAWTAYREQVRACDGALFFTPEYNRSVPGVLKNAVDIASRPYGQGVFAGMPAAIVGVVPGALGALAATQHLRLALGACNMPVMPGPELLIAGADKHFDATGALSAPATAELLQQFLVSFERWIQRFSRAD
jgi:chromate reductase, NAD(P)H dehydrogenase (quinone)